MTYVDNLEFRQRKHLFYPWTAQDKARPMPIAHAEGVWLTTTDGRKILDFNSSIFNANLGHGHKGIQKAMQKACENPKVGHPSLVDEEKAKLGENLARIAPGDLNKSFLTLGGAEANENAIKIAQMLTGRRKVMTRYRSYHGATLATINYSGDYRRIPFDTMLTGVVRFPDPYHRGSGQQIDTVRLLEEIIEIEGPNTIACILLESFTGTNGVFMPPENYWKRIRDICDRHGIILIADEVLTGFGRTGEWFGINHFGIVPDMITIGKGLTGGYVPLGGVVVNDRISKHFNENTLWCGLTHYAHPFCCAVANACIEAYESEKLIDHARNQGHKLAKLLSGIKAAEVRSIGLLAAVDLDADASIGPKLQAAMWDLGVYATARFNMIICAPPLCISESDLETGVEKIKQAIEKVC